MARVKSTSPIVATIIAQVLLFSNVNCFAGDYNTNPKIRINYLSQNSGMNSSLLNDAKFRKFLLIVYLSMVQKAVFNTTKYHGIALRNGLKFVTCKILSLKIMYFNVF
jgi:hypothetical protein